jgi:hypothetical protein
MKIPGHVTRWMVLPDWLRAVLRGLRNTLFGHSPVRRYRWTYAAAGVLLAFSTYSFSTYRVLGNGFVVLLPVVGTVFGYLWAILLADEILDLFRADRGSCGSCDTSSGGAWG